MSKARVRRSTRAAATFGDADAAVRTYRATNAAEALATSTGRQDTDRPRSLFGRHEPAAPADASASKRVRFRRRRP